MRLYIRCLLFVLALSASAKCFAGDLAGSADHPLVGRYEGSVIKSYLHKSYEEFRILTSIPTVEDRASKTERNSQLASGKYWRIVYAGPENRSPLEVVRNLESSLSGKGFEQLFSCRSPDCGSSYGANLWNAVVVKSGPIATTWDTEVYSALKLSRPAGDIWVSLLAVEKKTSSGTEPQLLVDIVEAAPMEKEKVVFIDANKMKDSLSVSGKVALYGIYFDTDKAEIRAESNETIAEIAKLLMEDPAMRVMVTGHTDSDGEIGYNFDLSKRRAEAVVRELSTSFGVPSSRMVPFGAGMSSPLATNDTSEGKAKNRRVELVKIGGVS